MKRFVMALLIGSVVSGIVLGTGTRESWTMITETVSLTTVNIAGFFSPTIGYGVGDYGNTIFTRDGGATWRHGGSNLAYCRFGLDIMNDYTAISFGNEAQVRITTDGGVTWVARTDFGFEEPMQVRWVSFVDENTGWAAGPINFGATSDGGRTWTTVATPQGAGTTLAISCLGVREGFMVDMDLRLYYTNDGGTTWSTVGTIAPPRTLYHNPAAWTPEAALRFANPREGTFVYATAGSGNASPEWNVLTTTDGGRTWTTDRFSAPLGTVYINQARDLITILDNITGHADVFRRN